MFALTLFALTLFALILFALILFALILFALILFALTLFALTLFALILFALILFALILFALTVYICATGGMGLLVVLLLGGCVCWRCKKEPELVFEQVDPHTGLRTMLEPTTAGLQTMHACSLAPLMSWRRIYVRSLHSYPGTGFVYFSCSQSTLSFLNLQSVF